MLIVIVLCRSCLRIVKATCNVVTKHTLPSYMKDPLAIRVGANIKAARESRGLTQRYVAESVKMETVSLSRIERGVALPSLATLDKLAATLGVPLGQLVDGVSTATESLSATLSSEIAPLNESDRLFVLDQMRALSRKLVEKSS